MRYAQPDKVAELVEALRQFPEWRASMAALAMALASRGWSEEQVIHASGGAVRDGLCVFHETQLLLVEPDPSPCPRHVPRPKE